jgi:hypothetical protein
VSNLDAFVGKMKNNNIPPPPASNAFRSVQAMSRGYMGPVGGVMTDSAASSLLSALDERAKIAQSERSNAEMKSEAANASMVSRGMSAADNQEMRQDVTDRRYENRKEDVEGDFFSKAGRAMTTAGGLATAAGDISDSLGTKDELGQATGELAPDAGTVRRVAHGALKGISGIMDKALPNINLKSRQTHRQQRLKMYERTEEMADFASRAHTELQGRMDELQAISDEAVRIVNYHRTEMGMSGPELEAKAGETAQGLIEMDTFFWDMDIPGQHRDNMRDIMGVF